MDMRNTVKRCGVLLAAVTVGTSTSYASEMASAAVVGMPLSGGSYSYNISVDDVGTTPIETFWFSWVPGAGFLSPTPTGVQSPAGWTEKATNGGAAIQWTTTTNALGPGMTLAGFNFVSTETPGQLATPVTVTTATSSFTEPGSVFFVYAGAPLSDAGYQGVATVVATPEPESLLLVLTGLVGAAGLVRRRFSC